jgi:hypothetical protein
MFNKKGYVVFIVVPCILVLSNLLLVQLMQTNLFKILKFTLIFVGPCIVSSLNKTTT